MILEVERNGSRFTIRIPHPIEALVTSIQDRHGRSVHYEYVGDLLVEFTDLESNSTTYEYTSGSDNPSLNNNLTRIIYPELNEAGVGYDAQDRVVRYIDSEYVTHNFRYFDDQVYTWVDGQDEFQGFGLNGSNDVTSIYVRPGLAPHDDDFIPGYDLTDRLFRYNKQHDAKRADLNGHANLYTYDDLRNMTNRSVYGFNWGYSYHPTWSRITKIKDPYGRETVNTYDAFGNVSKVINDSGEEVIYAYNSVGRVTRVTDPLSKFIKYEYDPNEICITNYVNKRGYGTALEYDVVGNVTNIIDPEDYFKQYRYNNYNLKTWEQDEAGIITESMSMIRMGA